MNEVLVAGDQRIDTVYLDRCLQWGFPKKLALTFDAPERWLMGGRDPDGQRYKVEITEGQRVKILPRHYVNDRLESARHLAFKAIETRTSD